MNRYMLALLLVGCADVSPWPCDPIDQTGCQGGETCRIGSEMTPACVPLEGDRTEGSLRCRVDGRDLCGPGLHCTGGTDVCRAYCDPAADTCGDGRHCDGDGFGWVSEAGVGLCVP